MTSRGNGLTGTLAFHDNFTVCDVGADLALAEGVEADVLAPPPDAGAPSVVVVGDREFSGAPHDRRPEKLHRINTRMAAAVRT